MNYSTLSSLISDDVTFISCSFVELEAAQAKLLSSSLASVYEASKAEVKTYTYKTLLKGLKEGDLVAIQATARDKPFGVHIVKVVSTDVQVDYSNNHIEYKWAFQKIYTDVLESIVKSEHELVQQVLNDLKEQGIEIEKLNVKLLR